MLVKSLYLRNFRIYKNALFEFLPNVNLIWGPNARGKTTILEAIYLLITGRSFRTSHTKDMIRYGQDFFYVEASFVKHGIEQTVKFSYDGNERKLFYNTTPCLSTTSLLGLIQGVVMTPDDIALVNGTPGNRRHYLDFQIAQLDPLYVHHITRYTRAMRQRNHLLKTKNLSSIESWEKVMAHSAAYVTKQRINATQDLQVKCQQFHKNLTDENLSLTYTSKEQDFLQKFQKNRAREMELGYTLTGPHKDDLIVAINQKEARTFASEGQKRGCVAAMRFAEWDRLNAISEESPLMLIDDIGVSLDMHRRKRLINHIDNFEQVFLTSTEATDGHRYTMIEVT